MIFDVIAFDGDDTLWHDLPLFRSAFAGFREILLPYAEPEKIEKVFAETEARNLNHFGYGVKGFTLSMIEAALHLSDARLPTSTISKFLELGKEILSSPVALLPNVKETLETLSREYRLLLVTKGDAFHQEGKLKRSGLADIFAVVEIVVRKDPATYDSILSRNRVARDRFLMVGNSLPSDIVPVLELGGYGVHIPYADVWEHDSLPVTEREGLLQNPRYFQLQEIRFLPAIVEGLTRRKQR